MKNKNKSLMAKILIFLSILGPGIITGSVDNDVGGITTYSQAGAAHGYNFLWTMIPAFIVLVVVQEMNARMGIVTGKGLADLIREHFGVRVTAFIFLALITADIGNTAAEFAGVAGSMQIFNISKYIAVPIAAILVWFIVVKGSYKSTEKVFLIFSAFLLMYIASALLAKPSWNEVGTAILKPDIKFNADTLSLVIGIVGTTIAPWMQFYMQSAVIEKGIRVDEYKYEVMDVVVGSIITVVVAAFIIIACGATLHKHGVTNIQSADDAAMALQPIAGHLASKIFAFGLFIAAIFSATILPLATAFYICEAFGFEAGVDKKLKEAPQFFTLFTGIMLIAIIIILIPNSPLITIILGSQVLNGMLLPVVLICMMKMVNDKEIMGEYVNSKVTNIIGYFTIIVLIILTGISLLQTFLGAIGIK